MKIELKNVKFYAGMSEETNAFTADVYADGKKIGYAKNDGCGGDTWINAYPNCFDLLRSAENYCKSLPDITWKYGDEDFSMKSNLENVVDNLFEKWLHEKEQKKLEKKMETSIMWGVPNGFTYTQVSFKKPLNQIDKKILQSYLDKYKRTFKQGEKFLNTNLVGFDL